MRPTKPWKQGNYDNNKNQNLENQKNNKGGTMITKAKEMCKLQWESDRGWGMEGN